MEALRDWYESLIFQKVRGDTFKSATALSRRAWRQRGDVPATKHERFKWMASSGCGSTYSTTRVSGDYW